MQTAKNGFHIFNLRPKNMYFKKKKIPFYNANLLEKFLRCFVKYNYSKTKTSWHLWEEHEASLTMPNFHLRAVFFVMESNIAYNLEIEYVHFLCPPHNCQLVLVLLYHR